jgi:hypothetical protein
VTGAAGTLISSPTAYLFLGYFMSETNNPTCKKCGRTLTLIGTLPSSGSKPTTSLYKCVPCVLISVIPPLT